MTSMSTLTTGMDPRAAKALSLIFVDLLDAIVIIRTSNDADMIHEAVGRRIKAEARIAQWLQEPMTTAHLVGPRGMDGMDAARLGP